MMQIRPSRLYLPKFDNSPATVFEYLLARFPQIDASIWRARISQGLVTLSDGAVLAEHSPYRHGATVFYRKDVLHEPAALEEPVVLYRDDNILLADKPHRMPVTPSGDHVERSLLVRLQRMTALPDLAPMHRLDRDTAGLVLFSIRPAARPHYHQLFAERRIEREYRALAHIPDGLDRSSWRVENRMEPGEPWFRQRIVQGPINAITEIELVEMRSGIGEFRLVPKTGRKHQLRVHMTSIGCPILGDPLYPTIREKRENDPTLQLVAKRLAFIDPLTGASHNFTSARTLDDRSK
jgi:tRNA pseudouridine32 synthase/23S rRNA pseudouridine746 synthase